MTETIQVGNQTINAEEVLPLLASYQMLPQLFHEIIIDQAIAPITCAAEEQARACQQFYQKNQLTSEADCQAWLARYGMTQAQLEALATRELRIEKFKRSTWGPKLESYFLSHKPQLDRVVYSLIRVKNAEVAQELYFRIQAGEQSFAEMAREYSQGPEVQTDGLVGPVELGTPHPKLAQMLSVSQPGQLWPPTRLDEWLVIVRLERQIPAQFNKLMRQHLLNRLFESWLQEQLSQQLSHCFGQESS